MVLREASTGDKAMTPLEDLPKRVQTIVERGRSEKALVKSFRTRRDLNAEIVWHFEPSGKSAPALSCQQAVDAGFFQALDDGLFEGTSQSFVLTWEARR